MEQVLAAVFAPETVGILSMIIVSIVRYYGDALLDRLPVLGPMVMVLLERHLLANTAGIGNIIEGVEADAISRTPRQATKEIAKEARYVLGRSASKMRLGPLGMAFSGSAAIGAAVRNRRRRLGKRQVFGFDQAA